MEVVCGCTISSPFIIEEEILAEVEVDDEKRLIIDCVSHSLCDEIASGSSAAWWSRCCRCSSECGFG